MADEKALGLSVLSTVRDWVKSLIPGTATTSTKGIVQPDGTTITINDGVISSVGGGGSSEGCLTFYGTCATAAATQAKVVVCEEFTSAHLVEGTVLHVKFTYAQTYNGAPTLNVNSTGAKNIRRVGTTNAARYEWVAGEMLSFVYDGTAWVLIDAGFATTTYYGVTKLSSATNSTSTALAATASAVKAAYDLADGKQDELVSGTNIKTVNGNSLLGSGDIDVSELPTVTTADNDKVLTVVSGAWAAATPSGSGGTSDSSIIRGVLLQDHTALTSMDVHVLNGSYSRGLLNGDILVVDGGSHVKTSGALSAIDLNFGNNNIITKSVAQGKKPNDPEIWWTRNAIITFYYDSFSDNWVFVSCSSMQYNPLYSTIHAGKITGSGNNYYMTITDTTPLTTGCRVMGYTTSDITPNSNNKMILYINGTEMGDIANRADDGNVGYYPKMPANSLITFEKRVYDWYIVSVIPAVLISGGGGDN